MKNKKIIILTSVIIGVLVVVLGFTYALFTFDRSGKNQELVLGDIWMKYTESNGISLENALPGAAYSKYFEFTITGKNTYTEKDIWYDIRLTKGDVPEGKTEENRIEDKYLKFKLVEVNSEVETEIFTDKTYNDLTNQTIHVATIPKSTNEYSKTYRLYMVISEDLMIGNVEGAISSEEFETLFGSIKVATTGDFAEKEVPDGSTDENCFNATKIISSYSLNTSDEAVSVCATYMEQQGFTVDGTYENYCKGTQEDTLKEDLDNYVLNNDTSYFDVSDIKYFINNNVMTNVEYEAAIIGYDATCGLDVVIPSTISGYKVSKLAATDYSSNVLDYLTENRVSNTYIESVDVGCGYYEEETYYGSFINSSLNSVIIPNTVSYIGSYEFKFNNLTSIQIPNSAITIGSSAFESSNLQTLIFEENSNLQTIGNSAFRGNNLTSIQIPNSVITIGSSAFESSNLQNLTFKENSNLQTIDSNAFRENNLTSVEIPNSVITIGFFAFNSSNLQNLTFEENSNLETIDEGAFRENNLTSVEIPNSVITIGSSAFESSNLQNLTFEENTNLQIIGREAFSGNSLTSVEIPNSVIVIDAYVFSDNNLTSIKIGTGIQYIDIGAFKKSSTSNSDLESITFDGKTCAEIKNIKDSKESEEEGMVNKFFPWLYYRSPYYESGYKTTIIGTDGECSY